MEAPVPLIATQTLRRGSITKPSHKAVPGYIVFRPLPLLRPHWEVVAHAVVEIEDSTLVDITPSGASRMYPFIRHVGAVEDFQLFADAVRVLVPERWDAATFDRIDR
jgi:hypothetical protein